MAEELNAEIKDESKVIELSDIYKTGTIVITKLIKVMVLGLSGSGKSSVLNALLNVDHFDSSASGIPSISKLFEPISANFVLDGKHYHFEFCDTRGLGDPKVSDNDIFESIQQLYCSDFNSINKVLICFKKDKLRADLYGNLDRLIAYLFKNGFKAENIVLCLTWVDSLKKDILCEFINDMKDHPVAGRLFRMSGCIVPVVLPKLSEIEEDDLPKYLKKRQVTVATIMNMLIQDSVPVKIMTQAKFLESIDSKAQENTRKIMEENVKLSESLQQVNEKFEKSEAERKQLMSYKKSHATSEEQRQDAERRLKEVELERAKLKKEAESIRLKMNVDNCVVM